MIFKMIKYITGHYVLISSVTVHCYNFIDDMLLYSSDFKQGNSYFWSCLIAVTIYFNKIPNVLLSSIHSVSSRLR